MQNNNMFFKTNTAQNELEMGNICFSQKHFKFIYFLLTLLDHYLFREHMQTVQTLQNLAFDQGQHLFAYRDFYAKYSKNKISCQKTIKLELDSSK